MTEAWVALFSGGKDSSWALDRALSTDRPVERLVTVHPAAGSYLYHVPATGLAELAAESVGIPLLDVRPDDLGAVDATDAAARGDAELAPLEAALADLRDELGGLGGVVAGAVESEFQTSRIEAMCDRLDASMFAPLWRRDPGTVLREMLDAGFAIDVVAVAARGLDATWLGRRLDGDALADLEALHDAHGVHLLGEGGEFETLVVDGPHMARRIEYEAETEWHGDRGQLRITDARLA